MDYNEYKDKLNQIWNDFERDVNQATQQLRTEREKKIAILKKIFSKSNESSFAKTVRTIKKTM